MTEDRGDRFTYDEHDAVVWLGPCSNCSWKHFGAPSCDAFPDGIPDEILVGGEHAHDSVRTGQVGSYVYAPIDPDFFKSAAESSFHE